MALADNPSMVSTPHGSEIAVYRAGTSGRHIFVVGGLGGRSIAQSPMGALVEAAARFGARGSVVDLSGTGKSGYRAQLTMDLWLRDLEHVFLGGGAGASIWIGSSIGAWLMLLLHRRHPEWFSAMCALAPAWDWDARFLLPGIADGTLRFEGTSLMVGIAPLPKVLVDSMAPHHVLDSTIDLRAPLHVIHGEGDREAPVAASIHLASLATGAGLTLDVLAGENHDVSRLATPAARNAIEPWLHRQVSKGEL